MFRGTAVLVGSLCFGVFASAQAPATEQLAKVFKGFDSANSPGCAAGVSMPGSPMWTSAWGSADLEHDVPNTPTTVFEAGSVSKQFTAAAVLLLVERGQVSLDDDIRKYFPELPKYASPVTVRHLLNHTSGLRDWGEVVNVAGWPRTTREYTQAQVLEVLSHQKQLNYAPGEAWSYTNSGYNLSAMLVEKVSGTSFQKFTRTELFDPLGMSSTQWRDDFHRVVPHRAIAYSNWKGGWQQDMPFEDAYGNGGLLTTVGDLLKWNEAISSGTFHPHIFEMMQQPATLRNGQVVKYGFGFFFFTMDGLAEVSHSGATAGYRAWLGRIPAKGLSVAILCNAASANTSDLAFSLERLYLGTSGKAVNTPAPTGFQAGLYRSLRDFHTMLVTAKAGDLAFDGHPTRKTVRFTPSGMYVTDAVAGEEQFEPVTAWKPRSLDEFTGSYRSDDASTTFRVVAEQGKLMVHRQLAASFPLTPAYADAFNSSVGAVRFQRDGKGRIVGLSLSSSRMWNLTFTRE